mmetsp:Transcript_19223/g.38658  ORF Transcript_19223/g.38658 Transcript_19223/m.38658 type:complete len:120 (-) Transcript_19223:446-805(-)
MDHVAINNFPLKILAQCVCFFLSCYGISIIAHHIVVLPYPPPYYKSPPNKIVQYHVLFTPSISISISSLSTPPSSPPPQLHPPPQHHTPSATETTHPSPHTNDSPEMPTVPSPHKTTMT